MNEDLTRHPASAMYRDHTPEESAERKVSLLAVGLLDPIRLYNGMVLDGWHRLKYCRELNIKLGPEMYHDCTGEGDPYDLARSWNLGHRHMTKAERDEVAEQVKAKRAADKAESRKRRKAGEKLSGIAAELGISEQAVSKYTADIARAEKASRDANRAEAQRRSAAGESPRDIARAMDKSVETVRSWLKRSAVPKREAKSNADRAESRRRRAAGESVPSIAKALGIHRTTVAAYTADITPAPAPEPASTAADAEALIDDLPCPTTLAPTVADAPEPTVVAAADMDRSISRDIGEVHLPKGWIEPELATLRQQITSGTIAGTLGAEPGQIDPEWRYTSVVVEHALGISRSGLRQYDSRRTMVAQRQVGTITPEGGAAASVDVHTYGAGQVVSHAATPPLVASELDGLATFGEGRVVRMLERTRYYVLSTEPRSTAALQQILADIACGRLNDPHNGEAQRQ